MEQGDRIKVLHIDNSTETRERVKTLLASDDDMDLVGSVASGKDGIELAKELVPDVAIIDSDLENVDGFDITNQLIKTTPLVGVIITSINNDKDTMTKAMLAGASFFLSKPLIKEQFLTVIKTVNQYKHKNLRIDVVPD